METNDPAGKLHDKATRGTRLSREDQVDLDAWYARQDVEEAAMLASTSRQETLTDLRTQVNTSMAQLLAATQRVQELSRQNDELRREITALKQQLIKRPQAI